MDWIEEFALKLKNRMQNASLRKGMTYTIVLATLIGIVAYVIVRNISYSWFWVIMERYAFTYNKDNLSFAYAFANVPIQISFDLETVKLIYMYSILPFILISQLIGIKIFFKTKVSKGYSSIQTALSYITVGDLGHEQTYFDQDELGIICDKVETLRKQLIDAKRREWDLQSEQNSINAAFAHDLRTPLTVMKGYTEFLLKYEPEGKVSRDALIEKLYIMHQQQERILELSKTMTQISNIEMRPLHCNEITCEELLTKLDRTLKELQNQSGKTIMLLPQDDDIDRGVSILADENLIMEVCENLISNALRYAVQKVEIRMKTEAGKIIFSIHDDGKGFSVKALKEAKTLYFSEEKNDSSHFGMGLYICEKLCEKHGGRLCILNGTIGGAICVAEFKMENYEFVEKL